MQKIQYEYTQIKAPISGIIAITNLNEGNYVNANTTLTTITKVDPIYVEFFYTTIRYWEILKSYKIRQS